MCLFDSFVETVVTMIYKTKVLIRITIISAWSWKRRSSSMIGEAASWSPNCDGCAIKLESLRYAGV